MLLSITIHLLMTDQMHPTKIRSQTSDVQWILNTTTFTTRSFHMTFFQQKDEQSSSLQSHAEEVPDKKTVTLAVIRANLLRGT